MKSIFFSSIQNKSDKTYENLVKIIHIPTKVTEPMISGLCFLQTFSKKKTTKFLSEALWYVHLVFRENIFHEHFSRYKQYILFHDFFESKEY